MGVACGWLAAPKYMACRWLGGRMGVALGSFSPFSRLRVNCGVMLHRSRRRRDRLAAAELFPYKANPSNQITACETPQSRSAPARRPTCIWVSWLPPTVPKWHTLGHFSAWEGPRRDYGGYAVRLGRGKGGAAGISSCPYSVPFWHTFPVSLPLSI